MTAIENSPASRPFLDVATLLETSEPAPQPGRLYLFAAAGLMMLLLWLAAGTTGSTQTAGLIMGLAGIATFGVMIGFVAITMNVVRRLRQDQLAVESIGELVQLRRWTDAAAALDAYLSRPARAAAFRIQALIHLAAVLARYDRFADAIVVQEHLLDSELIDPPAAWGLKVGRAMAMLREDHLFDADRAISELRREEPEGANSAGLALVEIYRDVKTGHPTEAIATFEKKKQALRDQLGTRVADAWALAARGYDLLGRPGDAQSAFDNATLLSPPGELYRRYPELEKLKDRCQPAIAPPEAA